MRKLTLAKEVLTELSSEDMQVVVAGATGVLCVTQGCVTTPYSGLDCLSDRFCG
jgi:hypothetical protein